MEQRANAQVMRAHVPLAEMFGYATDLRSATQGRASYTMQFSHYEPVPDEHRAGSHRAGRLTALPPEGGPPAVGSELYESVLEDSEDGEGKV